MPSAELRRLHQLHVIDRALNEIRNRAANLDPGRKTAAEIKALDEQIGSGPSRTLQSEQTDLELKQKTFQDKIAKFEKDLYGGKIVNPREVDAIQKEIAFLKRQRGELDERIMEIWEELPAAKEQAADAEKKLADLKQRLAGEQKSVLQTKAQLEAEFKENSAKRPELAKEISPTLLARYEGIRTKHGGVGMGDVDVRKSSCGACGTSLPTRTIEMLKDDRVVTCESCHRILYYNDGVV